MKKCALELKELIETVVLPDIEESIDYIFEQIAQKKETNLELNEELQQMHEMQDDFNSLLQEIADDQLDPEECKELLENIKTMINESGIED